jgi:hypothetical protein
VTTQPDPAPTGQKPARQLVEPLRETAALVLLGANAVLLFGTVLTLLVSTSGLDSFFNRAADSFYGFVNLATIGFPLIAVLLAAFVAPALPKAKLIVTVALVELAVSAVLGALFGLLLGLIGLLDVSVLYTFTGILARVAWLAVLGLVLYGVWGIYQGNYYTPRPKAAPGMYGQPGQQYPGQPYPGQQPYQQHPGQQPPQQQYGYPPQQQYGAPYGDPQHYGQQTTALPVQPPAGPPAAQQPYQPAPQSGPPYQASQSGPPYQTPQYPAPQSGPPQSGPPSSSVPPHVQPPAPQGPPPGYQQQGPPPGYQQQGPPPGYEQTHRNTDDR